MAAQWIDEAPKPRGGNRVEFYLRPKQDDEATQEAGRPIFKMLEYIKVEVPADKSMAVDRPVRDADRAAHRAQYEAFKGSQNQDAASGTLLSATGLFPPERIEELAFFNIRTVEQYGAVTDANLPRLGLYTIQERQKCRDFIESATSKAPLLRLQAQLDEMKNEREVMQRQMAELSALASQLRGAKPTESDEGKAWGDEAAEAPKRRGRPPKAAAVEAP